MPATSSTVVPAGRLVALGPRRRTGETAAGGAQPPARDHAGQRTRSSVGPKADEQRGQERSPWSSGCAFILDVVLDQQLQQLVCPGEMGAGCTVLNFVAAVLP